MGGIAAMALPQIGPILLERVTDGAQLGSFGAASRIPSALCSIPGAVGMAWYPQLFHLGKHREDEHLELCAQELKIIAILGIGLALPLALSPEFIIRLILGNAWVALTAPVLSTLCWMAVLNSISGPLGDALTTKGLQTRRALIYSVALSLGVGLYSWLGRTAGALGGGRAAVITVSALCVGLILANPTGLKLVAVALRRSALSIIVASAATIGIRLALPQSIASIALSFTAFFVLAISVDTEFRQSAANIFNRLRLIREIA